VIGYMLAQESGGKEFAVAYLSRRLVGVETRYTFIKKLCLSLYYACNKLHHYLLTSSCTIICQRCHKIYVAKAYFEWQVRQVGLCFDRV
jgi:hypothetical protein